MNHRKGFMKLFTCALGLALGCQPIDIHVPAPPSQGPAGPAGQNGKDGAPGAIGATGAPGAPGAPGATGAQGAPGRDGTNCWDLNQNGRADLPAEDVNGDGQVNILDCRGPTGATGATGANGMNGANGANGQNGQPPPPPPPPPAVDAGVTTMDAGSTAFQGCSGTGNQFWFTMPINGSAVYYNAAGANISSLSVPAGQYMFSIPLACSVKVGDCALSVAPAGSCGGTNQQGMAFAGPFYRLEKGDRPWGCAHDNASHALVNQCANPPIP